MPVLEQSIAPSRSSGRSDNLRVFQSGDSVASDPFGGVARFLGMREKEKTPHPLAGMEPASRAALLEAHDQKFEAEQHIKRMQGRSVIFLDDPKQKERRKTVLLALLQDGKDKPDREGLKVGYAKGMETEKKRGRQMMQVAANAHTEQQFTEIVSADSFRRNRFKRATEIPQSMMAKVRAVANEKIMADTASQSEVGREASRSGLQAAETRAQKIIESVKQEGGAKLARVVDRSHVEPGLMGNVIVEGPRSGRVPIASVNGMSASLANPGAERLAANTKQQNEPDNGPTNVLNSNNMGLRQNRSSVRMVSLKLRKDDMLPQADPAKTAQKKKETSDTTLTLARAA